jgi:hypothetical protein
MKPKKLTRIVVKEELVALTGDFIRAAILNQFIYWSEHRRDTDKYLKEEKARDPNSSAGLTHGWTYKSAKELHAEMLFGKAISQVTLGRRLKDLVSSGWLDSRHNPKHKWDRCLQYRPNIIKIQIDLYNLGYALEGYPLPQDVIAPFITVNNGDGVVKNDIIHSDEAIPETTNTETTTDTHTPPAEKQPQPQPNGSSGARVSDSDLSFKQAIDECCDEMAKGLKPSAPSLAPREAVKDAVTAIWKTGTIKSPDDMAAFFVWFSEHEYWGQTGKPPFKAAKVAELWPDFIRERDGKVNGGAPSAEEYEPEFLSSLSEEQKKSLQRSE